MSSLGQQVGIQRRALWWVVWIGVVAVALPTLARWATTRFALPAAIFWGTLFVFLLFVVLLFILIRRRGVGDVQEEDTRASVAVLPFVNLSADPDAAFLGDGLADEIITALSRVEGLRVVARTSSFAFRDMADDLRRIGRELHAESVLEGSVQRSQDRIRVTTNLVRAADGERIWSRQYDRELEDVFAIEDEIAESVVRALRVILSDQERQAIHRPVPTDVRAYEYYLRGRQYLHETRMKSFEFARTMFDQAIQVDPTYALAWAGLAEAGGLLHMFYPGRHEDLARADEASLKALDLAPTLAEAHAARGLVLFLMGQHREADERFIAAIARDPRLFQARYYYARACFQRGWMDEAARQFEEAAHILENYSAAFFSAQSLEALGRTDDARRRYARALEVVEHHMELHPDDPRAATMRAVALCRTGRPDEGFEWAERALDLDPDDAGVRYNAACLFALEGATERAIECLEAAIERGFQNRQWFEKDPDLASLRGEPRFQALMHEKDRTAGRQPG
jgi:adenylate cyclase